MSFSPLSWDSGYSVREDVALLSVCVCVYGNMYCNKLMVGLFMLQFSLYYPRYSIGSCREQAYYGQGKIFMHCRTGMSIICQFCKLSTCSFTCCPGNGLCLTVLQSCSRNDYRLTRISNPISSSAIRLMSFQLSSMEHSPGISAK